MKAARPITERLPIHRNCAHFLIKVLLPSDQTTMLGIYSLGPHSSTQYCPEAAVSSENSRLKRCHHDHDGPRCLIVPISRQNWSLLTECFLSYYFNQRFKHRV